VVTSEILWKKVIDSSNCNGLSMVSSFEQGTFYAFFRTSPAEFIIPYDQYMKSAEIDYSAGTRFRMLFEGEECAEQRCQTFGTYYTLNTFEKF